MLDLDAITSEELYDVDRPATIEALLPGFLPETILLDSGLRRIEFALLDTLSDLSVLRLSVSDLPIGLLSLLTAHLQLTGELDTHFIYRSILLAKGIDEVDHLIEDLLHDRLSKFIALEQGDVL